MYPFTCLFKTFFSWNGWNVKQQKVKRVCETVQYLARHVLLTRMRRAILKYRELKTEDQPLQRKKEKKRRKILDMKKVKGSSKGLSFVLGGDRYDSIKMKEMNLEFLIGQES